jgi:xylulokinase
MARVLGLDLSTQGVTALMIDVATGATLARAHAGFGSDFPNRGHPEGFIPGLDDGQVHADPLLWLDGLQLALDRLASQADLSSVVALAVSGQQHGSVYLAEGYERLLVAADPSRPLSAQLASFLTRRTSPIWMDNSTTLDCQAIRAALGGDQAACDLTGSAVTERFTGPQIRRFARLNPADWERTARVHLVSSFLTSVLAGCDAPIDTGDGAGMNLMELATGDWSPAALAATAPGLASRLPALVPGPTVVGPISTHMVARHGFSPRCQVIVGSGDNPSSLVGMAASLPGQVVVSLGTSDTLFAASQGIRTDPSGLGHAFGNPMGGSMSLVCVRNGSLARDAIRRELGLTDWAAFAAAINSTPPAQGVVLPLEQSEITPRRPAGRFAVGAPLGGLALARAAVEGQALNLRLHSRWVGAPTTRLLLTGGASENPAIAQIFADVFGAPVHRLAVSDSAALGAALRAAHAACQIPLDQLEQAFCQPAPGSLQPRAQLAPAYAALESALSTALR